MITAAERKKGKKKERRKTVAAEGKRKRNLRQKDIDTFLFQFIYEARQKAKDVVVDLMPRKRRKKKSEEKGKSFFLLCHIKGQHHTAAEKKEWSKGKAKTK